MKFTAATFAVIGITGVMLAGCGHGVPTPQHPTKASSTSPAPQTPLASNLQAFQVAAAGCQKSTPSYTTTLSAACAKVAEAALTIRRQYAAGIAAADAASMTIQTRYARVGTLPTTNAAAGLTATNGPDGAKESDDFTGSVVIGPLPGVITVTWAHGVLAGKKLVVAPVSSGSTNENLCWQVDAADTTVQQATRELGPELANRCNTHPE